MKLTIFQIFTIVSLIAFLIYEFWYLPKWMAALSANDPVIRTDIILFVPILVIFIIISLVQFFRKKKS
ncbi:hypothetical protein [Kaistella antarctica]|uniref:Uncharacterized protein n=1 Tax=Kaistella antarctica TaxID=266748 RepID=A0A3S4UY97_9FLAO|nr:hypothetical protein [Kaistella antarctica]KEY18907.1 hypothetical protein HY04_10625 [Kaistella antarctica]SEW13997.1 hypothetical protein SAMN05421765_2609 [Kaistella antarctica]VEH99244.1 Uncharacterised protein [Kaistella antarctica]